MSERVLKENGWNSNDRPKVGAAPDYIYRPTNHHFIAQTAKSVSVRQRPLLFRLQAMVSRFRKSDINSTRQCVAQFLVRQISAIRIPMLQTAYWIKYEGRRG